MAKINEIDITSLTFQEGSAPTTPASTKWKLYAKTDGLYFIDDAGTETGPFGSGSIGTQTSITFSESAAPSTPSTGEAVIYVKTDGKLYLKDDAGTETDLTSGGGGGESGTLVYSDDLTSTTNITVDTGTATYDGTEGAVDVTQNTRLRWDDASVDMATLGSHWAAEIEVRPQGGAICNFLSNYTTTGWNATLHRVEFRAGQPDSIRTVTSGGTPSSAEGMSTETGTEYRSSGNPGYHLIRWGFKNGTYFVMIKFGDDWLLKAAGTTSDTSEVSGEDLGLFLADFADVFIKNLKVYTY